MNRLGIVVMLLCVFFAALQANNLMTHAVIAYAAPREAQLPQAACPADELEEEGLSAAECEQLVANLRSVLVSAPSWFGNFAMIVSGIGLLLALTGVVLGAALVSQRARAVLPAAVAMGALALLDAVQLTGTAQAGPILRSMLLADGLLWLVLHVVLMVGIAAIGGASSVEPRAAASPTVAHGRFGIVGHWLLAVSIVFLYVSSWWMLALPLPSDTLVFREFPFQLHKNVGITILAFTIAWPLVSAARRRREAASEPLGRSRLAMAGHVSMYVLIAIACVSGYLSSSYSGWGTTLWWALDLPDWGREDEALNQAFSDLHLWSCWALLVAVVVHIAAAAYHACRGDGVLSRIVRW